MTHYQYKVIPAPAKGEKAKGAKDPETRFAQTIEAALNRYGESGWEYLRAELLPSEERSGLTGTVTQWRTLLIFRKAHPMAEPSPIHPVIEPVDTALPVSASRLPDPALEVPPLEGPRDTEETIVNMPGPEDRDGR